MTENFPVIGMSPGNSYFRDEVVKELLIKVVEKYKKVAILIADIPAISTYVALGYPENRARRDKALPQGNALRNRVERARMELGYSTDQVNVIDWNEEIENNPEYQSKYKEVVALYDSIKSFKEAANETTQTVLESSQKEISNMDSAIKIAVHYLLSEFAFMELAPKLLNSEKVTYIYHKHWDVYERYISGDFDGRVRNYLGFEITTTN